MVGKALSPLAPLCKGELLLQCEALPTIEGLLTEVSEKRKGCGRKAIPPVVARIFLGDSTSPLTRETSLVRSKVLLSFCNGCGDGEVGGRSLSLATDRAERILTLMKSQNVAIYNKK